MEIFTEEEANFLELECERILASQLFKRSRMLSNLLRYLLQSTLDGQQPKEITLALDVFNKPNSFDPTEDSFVRVYMHKLRARVDAYYHEYSNPSQTRRISIPKGSYLLAIESLVNDEDFTSSTRPVHGSAGEEYLRPETQSNHSQGNPTQSNTATRDDYKTQGNISLLRTSVYKMAPWLLALSAIICAFSLVMFIESKRNDSPSAFDQTPLLQNFWQVFKDNGRPTYIVLGDLYVYEFVLEQGMGSNLSEATADANSDATTKSTLSQSSLSESSLSQSSLSQSSPSQNYLSQSYLSQNNTSRDKVLLRNYDVNSQIDLEEWLDENPQYRDVTQRSANRFLMQSTAYTLAPLISAANLNDDVFFITTLSDADAKTLRDANFIYVGMIKSMGFLRTYFEASDFRCETRCRYDLRTDSGLRFYGEGNRSEDHIDYAVVTKTVRENGAISLFLAGFSDTGIMQAVRTVTDESSLLNARKIMLENQFIEDDVTIAKDETAGEKQGFSLLFETKGFDYADYDADMIFVNGHELNSQKNETKLGDE
uniref:hypothetical protein n=1 Tax=Ningiella ruwaisensis TaxID=2364274 RepID=UPI0010A07084|nr:hypothetical protein [Ningiella ruwaisensis]